MLHLWPPRNSTAWETSFPFDKEDNILLFNQNIFKCLQLLLECLLKISHKKAMKKCDSYNFLEYISTSFHSNLHRIESCNIKFMYHFFTMWKHQYPSNWKLFKKYLLGTLGYGLFVVLGMQRSGCSHIAKFCKVFLSHGINFVNIVSLPVLIAMLFSCTCAMQIHSKIMQVQESHCLHYFEQIRITKHSVRQNINI